MGVTKYAILGVVLASILVGTYYLGYSAGANNTRVEYVTKEIEVVKYIHKNKDIIYSKPHASRSVLLELMRSGKL